MSKEAIEGFSTEEKLGWFCALRIKFWWQGEKHIGIKETGDGMIN